MKEPKVGTQILKMSAHLRLGGARDGPITIIYGGRPNDETKRNKMWFDSKHLRCNKRRNLPGVAAGSRIHCTRLAMRSAVAGRKRPQN